MNFKEWAKTQNNMNPKSALAERIYQAGAASERVITIQDDDSLRFIKRVLEGANPAEQDKVECLRLIHEIRTRIRGTK